MYIKTNEEDSDFEDDEINEEKKKNVYLHEHEIKENGIISTLYEYDDDIEYLENNLYFIGIEKNNKIRYKRIFSVDERVDE